MTEPETWVPDATVRGIEQGKAAARFGVTHKVERIGEENLLVVGFGGFAWGHILEALQNSPCLSCQGIRETLLNIIKKESETP